MDPVSAFTVLKAASVGATALSTRSAAMGEAANLEAQASLSETQALQRDTASRGELDRALSGINAARAANGLSAFSPNAQVLRQNAQQVMDRERLIERANYRQQAQNLRTAATNRRRQGSMSLIGGVFKAGLPIAEYYNGGGFD